MESHDFSMAARIGLVLSVVGLIVALLLGTASEAVQTAVTLAMMLVAFAASLRLTGARYVS